MNRIFISHSTADKEAAFKLSEAFSEVGVSYWLDEQSIFAGSDISAEIGKAIDESSAVVFLLSNNSIEKSWQSTEVALALSKGKRVFPIVISKNIKIPILLQRYVYIDISESKDFKKAAFDISRALKYEATDTNLDSLHYETLIAKKELIDRQKEIYLAASKLKESEMKTRNFSLLFVSLCMSVAAGVVAFTDSIDKFNFIWSIIGAFLGAAAVEIGHLLKKQNESRETSKEAKK